MLDSYQIQCHAAMTEDTFPFSSLSASPIIKMMKKRKVQVLIYYAAPQGPTQVLLLRTNERRGLFWQNVTGGVEENEDFAIAAMRESKEETGISSEQVLSLEETQLKFDFTDRWNNQVVEKVFLLQAKETFTPVLDTNEHSSFSWRHLDELDQNCVAYPSNWEALLLLRSTLNEQKPLA